MCRKNNIEIWTDELIRWLGTHTSPQHPNGGNAIMLWNVYSNQCKTVSEAFSAMAQIQRYLGSFPSFPVSVMYLLVS